MNNGFFLKTTAILAFMFSVTHSGVIVLVDVPEEVADIVQAHQDALGHKIEKINKQLNSSYQFSKAQFSPHISLAFVSQEQLSTQAAKEKYPGLDEELGKIASEFTATDITDTFKNLTFDYWPGKFEMECGGSKKKNYANAVLKATPHPVLAKLSAHIAAMLEQKYGIKQAFPFSIHLTLGRICDANDQPISQEFKNAITKQQKTAPILIKDFKLKGHDGSEEVFGLSAAQ